MSVNPRRADEDLGAQPGDRCVGPAIEFYLREAMLPPGRRTAANQAEYGEGHVHRHRLIRELVDVGKLPLATVGEVLRALDDPSVPMHEALGIAHRALAPHSETGTIPRSARPVPRSTGSWSVWGGGSHPTLRAATNSPLRSRPSGA